jgi:hypothetical protein
MKTLNILICSSDKHVERQMAQTLTDEGAKVQTSAQLINSLRSSRQEWDFLVIDLDGMSDFMRSVLLVVRGKYPHLPAIGISNEAITNLDGFGPNYRLALDAYFSQLPRTAELIGRFPRAAAKYHHLQA